MLDLEPADSPPRRVTRAAPRAERAPDPTIWAVASGKGGVGKSVLSASLAIGLAQTGARAVAVDLDLGGANLHTLFGCARAPHTLADFALGRLKSIGEALTSTTVPGVRMLSGARATLDFANAPHAQKQKILRGLARIDAGHVVLDLGAGTSFSMLDAFTTADRRILVVTPEPTAIENAYHFLKAAFFRSLRDVARDPEVHAALASVLDEARRSGATPLELVEAASRADERVGGRLRARMRAFDVDIVVNRSDRSGDPGARIAAAGRAQLGASLRLAGSLADDALVPASVARGVPVMQLFPRSSFCTDVQALVATLLAGEPTTAARALAPAATPSLSRARDERRAPPWDLPLEQRSAAPGRALRARREQLGLELAALHEHTRICRRHLEAIEAERFAELPPEVIAREYVRQIAVALDVPDPEQHAQSFVLKARACRSAVVIAGAVSRMASPAPAAGATPSPEELLAGFDFEPELEALEPPSRRTILHAERGRPANGAEYAAGRGRLLTRQLSTSRSWSIATAAAPFLAIALVLSPYLWPPGRGPESPVNDIHTYYAPNVRFLASSLWEHGELPRWNPQDFAGMPLIADPQSGVYNPLLWLLALYSPLHAFGWLIVALACAGALGMLRLAGTLGCSPAGASAGAIAFALGGSVLFRLVELGHIAMAAVFLVPWVLLAFERIVPCGSLPRSIAAAYLVALMVVWMHPQLLIYTGLFLIAAGLFASMRSASRGRVAATLAAIAVGSACLTAVHWMPFLACWGEFARGIPALSAPDGGGRGAAGATWHGLVTGDISDPEAFYYLGGVTLFLALLGLLVHGRSELRLRALARFHGGAALAIAAYGLVVPSDFALAPSIFRAPTRVFALLSVPVALLVALGVDGLQRMSDTRRRVATALAAAAASIALFASGASPAQLAALAMAACGAWILGESGGASSPGWARQVASLVAAGSVILALGIDTGGALAPHIRTVPESAIGRPPRGLSLSVHHDRDLRVAEPLRDVVMLGIPELEKRRIALESLTGYNPLIPWRFWLYLSYASGLESASFNAGTTTVPVRRMRPRLFDLFGVTHFLYPPRGTFVSPRGPVISGEDWIWIKSASALPRAYLVPGPILVAEAAGEEQIATELQALTRLDGMDPRAQVMLHGDAASTLGAIGAASGAVLEPFREVPVRERRSHRIALELETSRPGILVLNEPYFPGWRARDAGEELPVLRANVLLRALALRAGQHRIELVFEPASWRIGRAISLAALGVSAALLLGTCYGSRAGVWRAQCSADPARLN